MEAIKEKTPAVIGLYTVGLEAYWDQFEGLKERIIAYGKHIEKRIAKYAIVKNFGLVDSVSEAREAGTFFNQEGVDLIFCHAATYVTSSSVVPVHQKAKVPVVVLNLQPTAQINYEKTTTGEWLANCNACVVPEIANAFERNGIDFRMVSGLLGMAETSPSSMADEKTDHLVEAIRAWDEIEDWVKAAMVAKNLKQSTFGFLGNVYSGMLDLYTDVTRVQAQTHAHVKILEMCDLDVYMDAVTAEDIRLKREEMMSFFEISETNPADPIANKPTEEQLDWAATVSVAQDLMVKDLGLDGLAYYYHGRDMNDYERLQSGFIAGHSLLTAKGIPCSGEGDLKTLIAMKIGDLAGVGGSFSEIVTTDYVNQTILLGHDGPFHLAIAEGKPILRGMEIYHGKRGSGISVEAKVKTGPVTTLNVTEMADGRYRLIIAEGESTDGPIMRIGNTQTPVAFKKHPDAHMQAWFKAAPTHHFALTIGHNTRLFRHIATLMGWEAVVL
ncbi:MAG: L-fucose/L-arabinose isomerase family protein [Acholeplasmataceae bacterium]|nr:L-fucose/L-arabinose isomerase family protein [Acholeplasmataceae bacterium]